MRISWSIQNALDKGFQRLLRPLIGPQGNIHWYEKWYETKSIPGVLPTEHNPPVFDVEYQFHAAPVY